MPASLVDLEARVAALEAERADYRAVLTAVNALGENQRELVTRVQSVENKLDTNTGKLDEHTARFRSLEDNLAEVKELLVRALDRDGS